MRALLLLPALLWTAPPQAPEARTALVIGNAAYRDAPLRNPVNDARAVAASLRRCGFSVTLLENANRETMRAGLRTFGEAIRRGGVGLFYFAGHGMQVKGRNFLIPVGADIAQEDEVATEALDSEAVLAKLESAGNRLNILILDACRNNPFGRAFRSSASGLAQMDAPKGTYIAFATAPGRTAADGAGAHGLYTQHLLSSLELPGLRIEEVFKRVRAGVLQASADQQMPWDSSSLTGDFFFVGSGAAMPTPVAVPSPNPLPADTPNGLETVTVLEHPEATLSLRQDETTADFALRLSRLGLVRLGKGYLWKASYDPDQRRLPVGMGVDAWAAPYLPARFGMMEVEVAPAEAPRLWDLGTDHWVQARFALLEGRVLFLDLQLVTPHRRLPLLLPSGVPPRTPKPGQVWVEPACGMEFCWVPTGSFVMGSPTDEAKRNRNEGPRHDVTLAKGFWMGRCEVMHYQWDALLPGNPSRFKQAGWRAPVEQVSWHEAQAFAKALNARTGTTAYRLPTEAEWEYACRAGTTTASYAHPGGIGWSSLNSGQLLEPIPGIKVNGKFTTHPSAQMKPNAWNLVDMNGNVAEWCEDVWHDDYAGAPSDGRAWLEGGDTSRRVIRGGDYDHSLHNLRSAWREGEKADKKLSTIGFRIVREAVQ